MTSKTESKPSKPVFTRLSPQLSHAQMVRNIVDALEKSGITVKQDVDVEADEGGDDE
jgi:dihydroorotate dehydrogenase